MKYFTIYASEEDFKAFIQNHRETILTLGEQGKNLIHRLDQNPNCDGIKEEFFDWEPLFGNACGLYGVVADVMTKETSIPHEYHTLGVSDMEEAVVLADVLIKNNPGILDTMKKYNKEINRSGMTPIRNISLFKITLYNYIQEITNPDYLSAYDCEAIFHLLVKQNHILGGKIWTTDDIKTRLPKHTTRIMTEEEENIFIKKVKKHIDPFMLNEPTEGEWNAIDTAILDTLTETNL